MFGSNFRDFVSGDSASSEVKKDERLTKSWHGFEKSDSEDSGNCSEAEEGKSSDRGAVLTPQDDDDSLIQSLIENIGEGPKSFIIEGDEEESFVTVPKNLTFTEMTDILNSEIVDDIQDYENRLITDLGDENFKNFCLDQLNLKLEDQRIKNVEERQSKTRSDHQHIYSNILSKYKRNMENGNHGYSVKELLLLAIAANDRLAEEYQRVLFAEENLSLLPLLVGGQRYIEIFTEKFPDLYQSLKEQTIKTQFGQVNFFSAIALRKEQGLLNRVFFIAGGKFQDLKEILQQRRSISDPLYGIFETATLAQNMGFINIVLNSIKTDARETDDQEKKDLFKSSFITLLESAISQEHVSVVEHLCTRCTKNEDPVIQQIYKEAFADDKVIQTFDAQIISKIKNGGNNGARKRKEEVYNLILKTASQTGNIEFITEVLKLIENDPQLSHDQGKQAFLQDSLITILENAISAKSVSVIECLCKKYVACSDYVINYLDQKLKNNEFDDIYESTLIALSDNESRDIITTVLAHTQIYQSISKDNQAIRQVIQNVLKSAIAREDYVIIELLCDSSQQTPAIQKIYKEEFEKTLFIIEKELDEVRQLLDKRPKEGFTSMFYQYFTAPEEVQLDHEYMKSCDIMGNLLHIRSLIQGNMNIQQAINAQAANNIQAPTQGPEENNSNEILTNNNYEEGVMGKNEESDLEKIHREAALRYRQEKHGQTIDNVLATEEQNHVDPKVTIPKTLDFEPPVENKQITHDREDSGCGSGSSTPEISEEVPVFNVTHRPEARDEKQIIDIKHNEKGLTPLHVAAQNGDVNEGDRLIKLGANIEITSETGDGNTALHLAAQKGHEGFVKLLLDRGANVNSVSSTGSGATPLHEAAYEGHIDIVKLLIARKATIDARDRHNGTPLKYASAQGNSEVVLYLLQKGADLYLQSKDGETALHSAAEYGHPGVAFILIDAAENKEKYVNVQSYCVGTALHIIAYKREISEEHEKVIQLLLKNGASPYLENNPITNASQNDFIKEHSLSMAERRSKDRKFIKFMTSLDYSIPPQVTPTEVPAQISGDNIPDNGEPDKTSKNAQESELPTKTILTLTAIGLGMETVALGMCFALDASLLVIGVLAAIGACFLVAAVTTAIVCYYESKSSVKSDNVTKVAANGPLSSVESDNVTKVAANGPPVNSPAAS